MEDRDNKNREKNRSRHTWIGDEDEVKRQAEMAERKTYTLTPQATRIVEKQRKKRTGFITDEELENSEIIRIEDRRTTLVSKEDISQTRIYDPLLHESDKTEEAGPASQKKPEYVTVKMTEGGMRKLLTAIAALVLVLLLFEISFFVMRSNAASLPDKAASVEKETSEILEENAGLEEKAETYGDEEQIKELKESWERLKEKLGNTE